MSALQDVGHGDAAVQGSLQMDFEGRLDSNLRQTHVYCVPRYNEHLAQATVDQLTHEAVNQSSAVETTRPHCFSRRRSYAEW